MAEVNFATEAKLKDFEARVKNMCRYLRMCPAKVHIRTAEELIASNIQMFNRIEELENEKAKTTQGEKSEPATK